MWGLRPKTEQWGASNHPSTWSQNSEWLMKCNKVDKEKTKRERSLRNSVWWKGFQLRIIQLAGACHCDNHPQHWEHRLIKHLKCKGLGSHSVPASHWPSRVGIWGRTKWYKGEICVLGQWTVAEITYHDACATEPRLRVPKLGWLTWFSINTWHFYLFSAWITKSLQVALGVKKLSANAGNVRDSGLIHGSWRSPGEENGNLLQYSCLENTMDRGAWWTSVYELQRAGHNWDAHTHTHPLSLALNPFWEKVGIKRKTKILFP